MTFQTIFATMSAGKSRPGEKLVAPEIAGFAFSFCCLVSIKKTLHYIFHLAKNSLSDWPLLGDDDDFMKVIFICPRGSYLIS